jgi:hypothetical protein
MAQFFGVQLTGRSRTCLVNLDQVCHAISEKAGELSVVTADGRKFILAGQAANELLSVINARHMMDLGKR